MLHGRWRPGETVSHAEREGAMRRAILAMVLLVLAPAVGSAQTLLAPRPAPQETELLRPTEPVPQAASLDSWDGLKVLKPNKKIRVVDGDFRQVKAQFLRLTEDTFTFRANGKEVTIPRSDIRMVSIQHSKAKQVFLLLLMGALVGASAAMDAHCGCGYDSWDSHTLRGSELAVAAGAGAALFGLAAAFSSPSDELIYFHDPRVPYVETPIEAALEPVEAGQPEGGNVFAPAPTNSSNEPTEN